MKSKFSFKKIAALFMLVGTLASLGSIEKPTEVSACSTRRCYYTCYECNPKAYFQPCASYHSSIVDALKSIGEDSSYSNRKIIAENNGISGYRGRASENIAMLDLLKAGRLYKLPYKMQASR